MTERDYLIGLTHYLKFGPASLKRLYDYYGDWQSLYRITVTDLTKLGIDQALADDFIKWRVSFDLGRSLELITAEKIQTVLCDEANYPQTLLNIPQPPLVIFYRGLLNNSLWPRSLSVVGSRRYSRYGERLVTDLIRPMARAGLTIVSGLALGIDALAHQATLLEQGLTVAVLGSGLDRASLYPVTNQRLAEAIINHQGVVMSEFPPGTPSFKYNFPRRNRIIAGLSQGTLVIEAALKSGSLITARYAVDYGKEVMAVPGYIYSEMSSGTNNLIQQGAKLIGSAQDILDALSLNASFELMPSVASSSLEPMEILILELLHGSAKTINELTKATKLDISQINARLSVMEIKGLVIKTGPASFSPNKKITL
jgi:DNA processing protein